ncbi:hypothetical protein ACFWOJ_21745 [Streptomyces sp. NPDC058439]|uniref:hypothetical protein n=1 Tax=Streptomyces sp. NPDC058439 TaxID=3346500 RepID=UPI0036630E3B
MALLVEAMVVLFVEPDMDLSLKQAHNCTNSRNEDANSFIWTASAGQIFAKVRVIQTLDPTDSETPSGTWKRDE